MAGSLKSSGESAPRTLGTPPDSCTPIGGRRGLIRAAGPSPPPLPPPPPPSAAGQADRGWCSSIHEVPNRSRSMAKRLANGVFSIFMKISPPFESSA